LTLTTVPVIAEARSEAINAATPCRISLTGRGSVACRDILGDSRSPRPATVGGAYPGVIAVGQSA
jgi:hypothetical protein